MTLASLSFAVAAQAQSPARASSARTYEEALAAAKARARALREAAAAAAHPDTLDTTPPVLDSIDTTGSPNVTLPNQAVDVDLDITDDLSGVAYYIFDYTSPTGSQRVWYEKYVALPLTHLSPTLTLGTNPFSDPGFSVYSEAGPWVAENLFMYDAAGNEVTYSGLQLNALGNSEFTLTNSVRGDVTGPRLTSGTIVTPTVSRSTPPIGTPAGTQPYVGLQITAVDKGNGIVSGVYMTISVLCHPSVANCTDYLRLDGTGNHAGQKQATITAAGRVPASQPLGTYVLKEVDVYDVEMNWRPFSTNLGTLFPGGTTITVNP
jgi:hypothetical protein